MDSMPTAARKADAATLSAGCLTGDRGRIRGREIGGERTPSSVHRRGDSSAHNSGRPRDRSTTSAVPGAPEISTHPVWAWPLSRARDCIHEPPGPERFSEMDGGAAATILVPSGVVSDHGDGDVTRRFDDLGFGAGGVTRAVEHELENRVRCQGHLENPCLGRAMAGPRRPDDPRQRYDDHRDVDRSGRRASDSIRMPTRGTAKVSRYQQRWIGTSRGQKS